VILTAKWQWQPIRASDCPGGPLRSEVECLVALEGKKSGDHATVLTVAVVAVVVVVVVK